MAETLDLKVAQALMRLRLIEHALHDHGAWSMEYAGMRVPTSRFIRGDRISFVGHFPPMCPLVEPVLAVDLYSGDEIVRTIPLAEPLDEEGCQVWWDLAIEDPVGV